MKRSRPGLDFVGELNRRWRGREIDDVTFEGFDLGSGPDEWPPRVLVRFVRQGQPRVAVEEAATGGWDATHVPEAVDVFEAVNLYWLLQPGDQGRPVPAGA